MTYILEVTSFGAKMKQDNMKRPDSTYHMTGTEITKYILYRLTYEGCNKIDERNSRKNKTNYVKILVYFSKRRTDSCALASCFGFFEQNLKNCLKIRSDSRVTFIKYKYFVVSSLLSKCLKLGFDRFP